MSSSTCAALFGCAQSEVTAMAVASRSVHKRVPSGYAAVGILLGVLVIAVWLLAENRSAPVVTQPRQLAPFSSVELAGSNVVTIRVGTHQSVAVHARKSMLGRVTTSVLAGTLTIGDAPRRGNTKGPISISVGVPSLASVTMSSGGSGVIAVTRINAADFTVTLAGSGVLRASGTASHLVVNLGGDGNVEVDQLVARDVRAALSGTGRILLTATRSLSASLEGNGAIQYLGHPPQLTKSVTGNGVIIPG
jgi:Putative auto-transporter adhesin, head GIN domain